MFEDFANVASAVSSCAELNDDDIIEQVLQPPNSDSDSDGDDAPCAPEPLHVDLSRALAPLDAGIIKCYRKRLVQRRLMAMERSEEEKKISVLDAMHMIASSWSAVSQGTIANSLKHCGFVRATVSTAGDSTSSMEEDSSAIDNDDFERLNPATTFAEFVEADDNVATCGELSLDEAIAEEFPNADATATSDKDDAAVPTSFADMLRHMDGIRSYVCTRNAMEDVLLDTAKLEGKLLSMGSKKVQKTLTDFFLSACHVSLWLLGITPADGGALKVHFNES
ncbi:hypothetical protein MTO96_037877 [Rhipicephalus appendiculatus]